MRCKVILLMAGICDGSMQIWRESLHRCNRIHVPLEGKASYRGVEVEHPLNSGSAYLLVNSFARNFNLAPENRYYHLYLDFQTVPPLVGNDILELDLEKDPVTQAFLNLIDAMLSTQGGAVIRVMPESGEAFFQIRQIADAMMRHLQLRYQLKMLENKKVERVIEYIEAHYSKPISNEEIAAQLHIDPKYLIRLFRKHMDMPPYQYLTQCRIEHALTELRAGHSVAEAAFSCGYQSENAFRIAFKRIMGCSPTSLLKKL